ncbi:hypothetical protein NIES2101_43015 [Calothrix sp. HK-06]|nr:hypothetical protein NIES2101_43015 [Calothrix sp. HK-06]
MKIRYIIQKRRNNQYKRYILLFTISNREELLKLANATFPLVNTLPKIATQKVDIILLFIFLVMNALV